MRSLGSILVELAASQKSSRGVSLYSRAVNRPAGRVIAAGAVKGGLDPDTVTWISAALTVAGLMVLLVPAPAPLTGLIVWLLLALGFAFDSADGQVARYLQRPSLAGEWLDHVVDAVKHVAIHSAVLVAWFRLADISQSWLPVPLAYQLAAVATFAGGTLEPLVRRGTASASSGREPSLLRAAALLPADYGILAASFLAWGWQPAFRVVYTLLCGCQVLIGAALLVKWYRQLGAKH